VVRWCRGGDHGVPGLLVGDDEVKLPQDGASHRGLGLVGVSRLCSRLVRCRYRVVGQTGGYPNGEFRWCRCIRSGTQVGSKNRP
jgi:hypothetical protein